MAGIENKLLTGTIIVIHSEKEAFVVKNTGNIKENIEKSSEVAPPDGNIFDTSSVISVLLLSKCKLSFKFVVICCKVSTLLQNRKLGSHVQLSCTERKNFHKNHDRSK